MTAKISKNYKPGLKEKFMCAKHKQYFKKRLIDWKSEIIKSNNKTLYVNNNDSNISSPDIIDQASSVTEKSIEMRTANRLRKLINKIDSALKKIQDGTYGYCEETGEPIGLKRLIARPIATLTIEAQEKHEKNEKIFADT
jgi:DnaK suppressor protein